MKFSLKKDDNVVILTGKDKGLEGKIIRVLRKENKVIVDGRNKMKKHQRARKQGAKGQIVEIAMPIHISNVSKK